MAEPSPRVSNLRSTLSEVLTSPQWSEPVTLSGMDGAKYDLERAEKILAKVEQSPAVRAVAGSGSLDASETKVIVETLENFMGEVEAKFVDGRPQQERPRAKAIQARPRTHAVAAASRSAPPPPSAARGRRV